MAFESERKKYVREHLWICKITVNEITYTFCENVGPIPAGLDAMPLLKSSSISPAKVSLSGGIGVRASASVSFNEGLDYRFFGTASAPVRFWANWRARNVGYQGGLLSLLSGYIVDGAYDESNFEQRDYIIESFSHDASGAEITAKDTLKMTSGDRAVAPAKSTGILSVVLTDAATSCTLIPAGVGDAEYPASGWIRFGNEVVSFTRSADVFTIVRAQYNTLAAEHGQNDLGQLCLYYNDNLSNIMFDLYTVYAGIPAGQINKPQWDDEVNLNLPGLYEALITEPTGVDKLAKELAESAPHFQYWDERINKIVLTAIKAPPTLAQCYTAEANLLENSTVIHDEPDMRISTVIVRFGQRDPTKKLDDESNYSQAQVRITPLSIAKYGGVQKFKFINSRWINNFNRAAAIRLAARIGRTFEEMPRRISFNLDPKDADVWSGQPMLIDSDLTLRNESPWDRFCMPVQVISVGESRDYKYEALEHTYGDALPEDEDSDDPNYRPVYISGQNDQLKNGAGTVQNLRDLYDSVWPDVLAAYNIVFIFDLSCVAGSSNNANFAVRTGAWPGFLTLPIMLDVRGLILGKGGNGADVGGSLELGGPAIELNADIRLSNTGTIGGGGDGGNYIDDFGTITSRAAGGGGAGFTNGLAGTGTTTSGTGAVINQPQNGSNTLPGAGGLASNNQGPEPTNAAGESGNQLGDGVAITLNGNTITYINTGTILGAVS